MAAQNYAHVIDGVVENIIVLDPDQTNPKDFAKAIGGDLIDLSTREEIWVIGAKWDGTTLELPPQPEQPEPVEPDPNAPPPPASVEERLASLQEQIDDVTAMLLEG